MFVITLINHQIIRYMKLLITSSLAAGFTLFGVAKTSRRQLQQRLIQSIRRRIWMKYQLQLL